jgi:hypothetical protein
MRLCWADKIPLVLFALITVALLVLGGFGPVDSEYCRYLRLEHPDWTNADSYCFVTSAQHWSAFLFDRMDAVSEDHRSALGCHSPDGPIWQRPTAALLDKLVPNGSVALFLFCCHPRIHGLARPLCWSRKPSR